MCLESYVTFSLLGKLVISCLYNIGADSKRHIKISRHSFIYVDAYNVLHKALRSVTGYNLYNKISRKDAIDYGYLIYLCALLGACQ